MKRKEFVKAGLMTAGIFALSPMSSVLAEGEKPQLDPKLVQEFVGLSHRDIDKVKEMLAETPTLLNAAHDWTGGDFETGLGAASHVGHKEMAKFLIEQGAQANIFTAALFGRMEIIKPLIDFFPASLNAKGPHGFTLLHHASRGGEEAREVKEYLESMGAKETKIPLY